MTCHTDPKGAVMIMIIISMVLASIVGVAMVDLTTTATFGQLSATHQDRAYYMAESGGRYAVPLVVDDIVSGVTTNIDLLHNITYTLDNGSITDGQFLIEVDADTDPDYVFVHSTGIVSAGISLSARSKITFRLTKTTNSPFRYGSFGGSEIHLDDNAQITGDAGVNAGSNKIKTHDSSVITGDQDANVGQPLPAISFPSGTYTAETEYKEETVNLSAGTYYHKKLKMLEDAVLNISGDVTINVKDEFKIEKNAQIIILSGASLTVYVKKKIEIKENAKINQDGDAEDFILYQSENQDFKIKDNAIINGGLYAPLTDKLEIEKQAHVTGSVVADKVKMKEDSQITYDSSLSEFLIPGGSSFLGDLVRYYGS